MSSAPLPLPRRYKGPTPLPPPVSDSAIDALKVFEYKEGDILIATYPKCGTHWMNEVVQLILHEGDITQLDFRHRRTCLELKDVQDLSKLDQVKPTIEFVGNDPSPRVLMTHLIPWYLSEETWKKRIPIVCVFRDPRDVAISEYKFMGEFKGPDGHSLMKHITFDMFLEIFISDETGYGNWCDHALAYEQIAAKGENILFVTYEEMKKILQKRKCLIEFGGDQTSSEVISGQALKIRLASNLQDLTTVIKSVAKHIGHEVTDEVVAKVVANSTVEAMRKSYQETAKQQKDESVNLATFVKSGVAGKWKTEVSADKWQKLNERFKEKVKDSVHAKRYFDD